MLKKSDLFTHISKFIYCFDSKFRQGITLQSTTFSFEKYVLQIVLLLTLTLTMLQLRQKNELIFQRICPPSTSHAGNTVLCSNHTQKKERQTWSFPFFTAGKMNQDLLFSLCCSDLWISTFQPPSLRPWPVFQTVSGEVSELLGISLSLSAIATSKASKVHFFFWRGIAHTKRHIKCLLREVTLCQVGESFFFLKKAPPLPEGNFVSNCSLCLLVNGDGKF